MDAIDRRQEPYLRDRERSDQITDYLVRTKVGEPAFEWWPRGLIAFSPHPNGGVAVSNESPTIAAILQSIDRSYRHRLGRSPSPQELLGALALDPAARAATQTAQLGPTDRAVGGIDVEELPSPIRQDPFNALNNYPIVGFASDGRPIRSNLPDSAVGIDQRMERKEHPNEDLPWQRPHHWRDI